MPSQELKILAVDSSGKTASVGIISGDKILCDFYIDAGLTHSQTLVPMIDYSLKCLNIEPKEIDLFAAVNGPGSFVGVRIGVSAINGLSVALDKPCIGVSRLHTLAFTCTNLNVFNEKILVSVNFDARRNEIYNANFFVENGEISRISSDRIGKIDDFLVDIRKFNGKTIFVGDVSENCFNRALELGFDKKKLLKKEISIKGSDVAFLAKNIYNVNLKTNKFNCEPIYLRNP